MLKTTSKYKFLNKSEMKMLKEAVQTLKKRRKLILIANLYYIILFFIGVAIAAANPQIQESLLQTIQIQLKGKGILGITAKAYMEKRILEAWLLTFVVNLILASLIQVTLLGLIMLAPITAGLRAILWGIMFAPIGFPTTKLIIALPTIILEGESYILALVTGILLGTSWIKPNLLYQNKTRKAALKQAIKETLHIYIFIIILLAIAALTEVYTVTTQIS